MLPKSGVGVTTAASSVPILNRQFFDPRWILNYRFQILNARDQIYLIAPLLPSVTGIVWIVPSR
jgi:hypothetical protein